jgi:hypothetical protein
MGSKPILAPLGPMRSTHAGADLVAYRRDLRGRITSRTPDEHIARLYAARVIEVDDAFCRDELGLVVAADRIERADLTAVLALGRPAAGCGHEAPRLECEPCVRVLAWGRMVSRLRGRG